MDKKLKEKIEKKFAFSMGLNQYREIERLIFEIGKRQNKPPAEVISSLKTKKGFEGKNIFFALKNTLLRYRFPLTYDRPGFKKENVFLSQVKKPLNDNWKVSGKFKPVKIFLEKETENSYLITNLKKKFSGSETRRIPSLKKHQQGNNFRIAELKKPEIFITNEIEDFIKPCPCTKHHLRCGYWIFNLGFGCPFDCSYCFLQQYTNSAGIVLPANLERFFDSFNHLEKKLKKPIRIGTGEFSDSLALDDITEYSLQLIPYFREKKVFFEFKTKSNNIQNILKSKPSPNIIISWSLNPQTIIAGQEKGTASLNQRLNAASKAQKAGFRVGFHFDPIIYYSGWEKEYRALTEKLYQRLRPPFAWISLGTLRCNRALKSIAEQRFPQSNIFYGELLLGKDKKLRYPLFLRKKIYAKILKWIGKFDQKTPIYLCMEDNQIWKTCKTLNAPANLLHPKACQTKLTKMPPF